MGHSPRFATHNKLRTYHERHRQRGRGDQLPSRRGLLLHKAGNATADSYTVFSKPAHNKTRALEEENKDLDIC